MVWLAMLINRCSELHFSCNAACEATGFNIAKQFYGNLWRFRGQEGDVIELKHKWSKAYSIQLLETFFNQYNFEVLDFVTVEQ